MSLPLNRSLKSMTAPYTAFLWLFLSGLFYFRNWDPLTDHPASLIVRQTPVLLKDLTASLTTLISSGLTDFLGFLFLFSASAGAGSLFLILIRVSTLKNRRLILSAGTGTGLLAFYTLMLGLCNAYNQSGKTITILLLTAFSLYGAFLIIRSAPAYFMADKKPFADIIFFVLLTGITTFLCAKALKPAVFYDAVTYHLGVPNYYLLEGGIKYIPYDSFSNFPFLAEMLYTLGLFISGLKLAQLTSVLIFFLTAAAIYDFCRVFLKNINPVVAPILYISTPAFMETSVLYTNDLHLAFYMFLMVYTFFLLEKEKSPGALILSGTVTGFCLATKYTALISVSLLTVFGLLAAKQKINWKGILKKAPLFVLPALIIFAPWLIKNMVYTGNPFYPAFYPFFGGQDMTPEQYRTIMNLSHPPKTAQLFTGILLNPFNLLFPDSWQTSPYGAGWNLGPCLACFLPLIFCIKKVSPVIKRLGTAALILFLVWNSTFLMARFLFPAVLILLIISAYAVSRMIRESSSCYALLIKIILTAYIFTGLTMGVYTVKGWSGTQCAGFTGESDKKFLLRQMIDNKRAVLYSFPVYEFINENLEEGSRVLIIGDAQHLYIKRRHVYTYLSGTTPYEIFRTQKNDPAGIAKTLAANGITHIVYNPLEMARLQKCGAISYKKKNNADIENFLGSAWVKQLMQYRYLSVSVTLFKLNRG